MAFEFKFPDVGEGIHEGEIVRWRVSVGDTVKEDDPLVEMETAKAIVELPSPKNGKILELRGKEGQSVHVGDILVIIDDGAAAASAKQTSVQNAAPGVVGKIPTDAGITLPPRKPETSDTSIPAVQPKSNKDAFGPVSREPVKAVRKAIAEHMVKSAFTIPHVTHFDECDAGTLIAAREKLKPQAEKKGIKLTFLPYIVKAAVETLKKHPGLNAEFGERAQEIIYKNYFNIGIAVDTEEGLMVPVIKNADKKDELQIAKEIAEKAIACRERKINMADLQGGSFSITNIGSIGGIYATPIITYGQSANLGVFRIKEKPVALDGKVVVRPILTFALSFDHRVIDGAEAARFMNDLIATLQLIGGPDGT